MSKLFISPERCKRCGEYLDSHVHSRAEDCSTSQADEIQFAMGCVKDAGGQNIGVTYLAGGPLIWWTDGKTHSTLAMKCDKITSVFDVSEHIAESRAKFEKKRLPMKRELFDAPSVPMKPAKPKRDWSAVKGEMCTCGHLKSLHCGVLNHGPCSILQCSACARYTWAYFVGADGKRLD